MSHYQPIDRMIIDCVVCKRDPLYDGAVRAEARVLLEAGVGGDHDWRVVDRRLQALRKSGRIHYIRAKKKDGGSHWVLGPASAAGK